MTDEAIQSLHSYANTVEEELGNLQDLHSEIEEKLQEYHDAVEEAAGCVVNTITVIADTEILSDEQTYEMYENFVEKDDIQDLLTKIKKNLNEDYKLFKELCDEGFNMGTFSDLVDKAFQEDF